MLLCFASLSFAVLRCILTSKSGNMQGSTKITWTEDFLSPLSKETNNNPFLDKI